MRYSVLTDIRSRLGFSQGELATYLGVSLSHVKKLEAGFRTPGKRLIRIIQILGLIEILAPDIHEILLKEVIKNEIN